MKKFSELLAEFENWSFKMKIGDKAKLVSGEHRGHRGQITAVHNGGESYTMKHEDGAERQHHISSFANPN